MYSDTNNQKVSVISNGKTVSSSSPNLVSYKVSATPELTDIFPSAGFAGSSINLLGKHEISNLGDGLRRFGDVIEIKLGNDICSRLDVEQDAINQNSYSEFIRCTQSSTQ